MVQELIQHKEKKVEYVELIYDLIFVYIIGRNNALLHNFENGFVAWPAFAAYLMTTLAVIQIWNYTTYYVNIYGRHGVRDHVFLFVNMFLLYFLGESIRSDWQGFHTQYHIAWALILMNIGLQYGIELRKLPKGARRHHPLGMLIVLLTEGLLVLGDIPVYRATGTTWLSLAAVLFGMGAVLLFGQRRSTGSVDFPHLSERVMLYVVLTFGEMIIAIAAYFEGEFSLRSTYFALMAFLIVVGLFLSYGVFYDHIIDREKKTNGLGFMLLHIIIIFAMNNITNGLEFMRDETVALLPKTAFLAGSFLLYFGFLFALGLRYAKARCSQYSRFCLRAAGLGILFSALMLLLRQEMLVNIALTVVFVFAMLGLIHHYGKQINQSI